MTTLDERLREANEALGPFLRVTPPFEALRRRRRNRRRRAALATATSVAVLCGAVALVIRAQSPRHGAATPSTSAVAATTTSTRAAASTTTPTTAPAAGVQPLAQMPRLPASAVHTVHLSQNIGAGRAVFADGALWMIGARNRCAGARCPWLFRVDPVTGRVTSLATVPLPRQGAGPIAIGDGAAFVVSFNYDGSPLHVMRVDLSTGAVGFDVAIPGTSVQGNPRARISYGAGAAWVSEGDLPVVELDQRTGAIRATITLPQHAETNGEVRTVFNRFGLWLVGGNSGTVVMLADPATRRASAFTGFGPGFTQSLAADDRYVWMTAFAGNPVRLDLVRVDLAHPAASKAAGIPTAQVAAGDGQVWFLGYEPGTQAADPANHSGIVGRIDPVTLKVVGVTDLHFGSASMDPQLFVANGSAWVFDDNTQTVTRITPP